MSLHVCPGEIFILDSHLANFWERNCRFGSLCLKCFDCGAVALKAAYFSKIDICFYSGKV